MKNIPESMETARLAVSNLEDCCWQIVGEIENAFGVHSAGWNHAYAPDEKTLPAAMQSLAISLDAIAGVCEDAARQMAGAGLPVAMLARPEPAKDIVVVLDPPAEDGMRSARFDAPSGEWVPEYVDGGHATAEDSEDEAADTTAEEDASWRTSDFADETGPTPDTPIGTGHIIHGPTSAEPEPATPSVAIPENPVIPEKAGPRPRSRRSAKKPKKKSR